MIAKLWSRQLHEISIKTLEKKISGELGVITNDFDQQIEIILAPNSLFSSDESSSSGLRKIIG
jgi:hypothetical protein